MSTAQTLAHPGWVGSGMTGEPWWRSAVFYTVDPLTFQDSDGDGRGDLAGLSSRLDYIGTLGADALILASAPAQNSPSGPDLNSLPSSASPSTPDAQMMVDQPGFDDLLSEASRRHIRVVVTLPLVGSQAMLLAQARLDFTRGAAGIELVAPFALQAGAAPAPEPSPQALASLLLPALRSLAASFPGERIVLTTFGPADTPDPRHAHDTAPALVVLAADAASHDSAAQSTLLRTLLSTAEALAPSAAPDFRNDGVPHVPASTASLPADGPAYPEAFWAVHLMTLRGAATITAGQELGLPTRSAPSTLLQWTPTNISPPTVKIEANSTPAGGPEVYGAYHPYVKPTPKPTLIPGEPPPAPDPDTLPGFTTSFLPSWATASPNAQQRNVAVEDNDPHSLLNLYRRLIALHHGNPALRSGTTTVLSSAEGRTLIWVRHSPGARTAGTVLIACNLSDTPVSLSLDAELARLHLPAGRLRPLLAGILTFTGPQSTAHLDLPPLAVYIGEIARR